MVAANVAVSAEESPQQKTTSDFSTEYQQQLQQPFREKSEKLEARKIQSIGNDTECSGSHRVSCKDRHPMGRD